MKILKTVLAILMMGVMVAALFGCGAKTNAASTSTQVSTVKKGNLSLDITAAGNLALSVTQDLPIDLFYQGGSAGRGGTVGQVLVQVGDTVKKGQVLVSVDPTEWADALLVVQNNVSTAQRNVTNKSVSETDSERALATYQRAVTTAQKGVTAAQRQVDLKNLAVQAAQLSVQSANSTLNAYAPVATAKDAIDTIRNQLILGASGDTYWATQKDNLQKQLAEAIQAYNDLISGTGVTLSTDVALMIAQKEFAVTQAQSALIDAQTAVDDAMVAVDTAQQAVDDANYAVTKQQQAVVNAKADVDDANSSLADAQKKLTDAQAMSPEITAPFDGFVTALNVKAGDNVYNGTIAVTVADPNKFEANILVSEMDIMKVSIGGDATITLNALPGVSLPAKITQIAPTATIASGVVNYSVTVNITSPPPITASSTPAATANATGQQGVPSGNFTSRAGGASGSSSSRSSGQLPSTVAQSFQLKQGLTGTVDLVVAQRTNVLVVPNSAITKAGNQSSVQVVTGNNTIEKRTVQIGLADWQNTEITSGLSEGEKIMVPKNAAPTSTTTASQARPQAIPFLGR